LVGVINLRKTEVIPVLDLRERFSLPRIEDRNTSRIIVCVVDNRIIGLRVDAVVDVIDIAKREISGGVSVFHGNTSGFFAGVCHHRGKLIVLLNLKRLLSSADRIAIDAVWQQSSQHEPQGDAS
jgi:purine-binding chemotaxis protein CheW